jgi:GAF domain-containing protein
MPTVPSEQLLADLETIGDDITRHRLFAAIQSALIESVRSILEQFSEFRHILLYFNTQADWDAVLRVIRDTVRASAIQVVCLEGLDKLSYHMLPAEQSIDEDFASLLHDGLTIDDQSPDGMVRLGMLLAVNDDLLGILMVVRHNGEPFSDYERILLTNFADELAIALHNLELYGLLTDQANRLAEMVKRTRPGDTTSA